MFEHGLVHVRIRRSGRKLHDDDAVLFRNAPKWHGGKEAWRKKTRIFAKVQIPILPDGYDRALGRQLARGYEEVPEAQFPCGAVHDIEAQRTARERSEIKERGRARLGAGPVQQQVCKARTIGRAPDFESEGRAGVNEAAGLRETEPAEVDRAIEGNFYTFTRLQIPDDRALDSGARIVVGKVAH